jgi:uncharacterized RDD family membrane protein YckC
MFWHFKSATPGKMILGIKIVDANTMGKASPGKLLIRYLGYYISMLPLCLGIDAAIEADDSLDCALHSRRQGINIRPEYRN